MSRATKKSVGDEANATAGDTAQISGGDVSVQPLRRFMDGDVFRTPHDEPFTVSRLRAADLRANGLVAIVSDIPSNKMSQQPETKG
ncbi:hypothetical protein BIY26_09480 [Brenneria goodwinii]|uniref:Uncharacterized protein n=1 Tax=Brenneria goodwinii TaxID=1109412 RepID=A0AAE8EP14_9GAMM|nr:hypothetical protein [Brenneria goodwinii]ATA23530.1 hypothetical protein AWC36_05100 [Brenneria goodwinii]RLM25239.1 hypothetical protein BIY26_09480 [Brenneria goodwinii]